MRSAGAFFLERFVRLLSVASASHSAPSVSDALRFPFALDDSERWLSKSMDPKVGNRIVLWITKSCIYRKVLVFEDVLLRCSGSSYLMLMLSSNPRAYVFKVR